MPNIHLVMPQGMSTGTSLTEHGRHGEADFHGVALLDGGGEDG